MHGGVKSVISQQNVVKGGGTSGSWLCLWVQFLLPFPSHLLSSVLCEKMVVADLRSHIGAVVVDIYGGL